MTKMVHIRVLCVLLSPIALLGGGNAVAQNSAPPGFVFLPFGNNSDFQGRWDVGIDVPRFLSAYVKERYKIPTVSPAIVKNFYEERKRGSESLNDVGFWQLLFTQFGIRYLVTGAVETFDISRFSTGQPLLGGYEAFKGTVAVTFVIYDLERTAASSAAVWLKRGEANGEYADRSLTLTLFGKQSDRTLEYRDLDKIRFGSEDFNRTVIGQACFQLGSGFSHELESAMPAIKAWGMTNPDSLLRLGQMLDSISLNFKPVTIWGNIVFLEGESAFINLGGEDGVQVGQQLVVYRNQTAAAPEREAVGEIRVTEVRGPHLSLVRILSGQKQVKMRDRVSVTVVR